MNRNAKSSRISIYAAVLHSKLPTAASYVRGLMNTVVFLMGPTASGKTGIAVDLSQLLQLDIISVDSGMVYIGLNIGTAKPTKEEQQIAPHQLIDICEPNVPYSAARFRDDALVAIQKSFNQKRIPLLVGGTMLYFHVLKHGLANMPRADNALREGMLTKANQFGWQSLHDELRSVDPVSAAQIHPNDPQRIQRALEIYLTTGKTRMELWEQEQSTMNFPFKVLPIILAPLDRSSLHHRIKNRFYQMLERGFIEEVEVLYQRKDLDLTLPSMRAVGYRQVWQYLEGKCSKEEMQESSIIATRQLAKRQLTWLRRWENASWIDVENPNCLDQVSVLIQAILTPLHH